MNTVTTTSNLFKRGTLALLAATVSFTGIGLLPALARAADASGEAPQKVVGYADLNLSNPAGIQALYRRIENAARQVCGSASAAEIERSQAVRACQRHAVAEAVAKIDNPMLNGEYLARTGHAVEGALISAAH